MIDLKFFPSFSMLLSPRRSFPSLSLYLSISFTRRHRDTLTKLPASPVNSALRIITAWLRTTVCARHIARHKTGNGGVGAKERDVCRKL